MRRDALILFARAPRLGTVKRRLAQGIGAMAALRFYRGQLRRLVRELGRDPRWRLELAVTPDGARWPAGAPLRPQGRGDLGQRMQRALGRHRRAVLVGSDIPGLGKADVAAAFRALGRADAVFGPSEDGGYWLVGFGPRRPEHPFAAVRWSTGHALADTLANCRGHRIALLRRLRDVDTAEDLEAAR
ncbi:TIGR04282 family arsenosugar biosynthesis glycosyltransferase [Paeniroseomonas aquatica]|uniref:TIGR04282 family arsenosugar biosynthesis glycosyltransferase n=1 Tax=Paeniroseomonas aquatica TaxID=373043 RepID=A0ABT8A261_9PROT|nr:TIGR04282 family arsenosugar biosynthesis glycosyltransferase [Paeniroseomonas aquatica]MDN3563756.1 TIGR04282 family arsenosugar biosynthesis glycosyltransferase [Paeniroseomonas aquatica]